MPFSKGLVNRVFGKAAVASAALGAMLFFAGAPAASAADRDDCVKRIRKTERKLHEAIERHGYYSKQADHWRHERNEAYERCHRYGYSYRDRDYRYRDPDGGWYDRDGTTTTATAAGMTAKAVTTTATTGATVTNGTRQFASGCLTGLYTGRRHAPFLVVAQHAASLP